MELLGLIPEFGGLLYTVAAFVVALSVIVAVHEYGHYIVGRWTGIHAEVFSLGFGPVLFSREDRHGTKWQVAALPFGGYVKFFGDANAASGKDPGAMNLLREDPELLRRTMHGAPLWARAATVAAGPAFNFIMSILVFAAIFMFRGVASDPLTVGAMEPLPETVVNELRVGDQITGINGVPTPDFDDGEAWSEFSDMLEPAPQLDYTVLRNGQETVVTGPWLFPPLVGQVAPRSAAMDIDLMSGDVIASVDGEPIYSFSQLKDRVEGSDGRVLMLDVWRNGQILEFALAPRRTDEPLPEGGFQTQWRIGIVGGMAMEPATEMAGPIEAAGQGVYQTWRIVQGSFSGIWHMITGSISTCNISGPLGIAETSGAMASQGAQNFIWFIALLSTAVGLMNLFPIPVLDGGHLVFYAYEAVTGRPPNELAVRVLTGIGLAVILSLMLFALGNDLVC